MVQTAPKAKAIAYPQADQTQVSKQAQVAPKAPSVQRSQTRQLELMVSKTRFACPVCIEMRGAAPSVAGNVEPALCVQI